MTLKTINRNGLDLAYVEYGSEEGFPILVQHGLIASIQDSALFERLIQSGARLICIARPGYGASSPQVMRNIGEWGDIVAELVGELQLSRFDVLGMSSGAPYSYAIGDRFPGSVRNIYIFSGIPALYDDEILAFWPHPVDKRAQLADLQKLAKDLFFSNLTKNDLEKNEIKDSMAHHCFGIAQDFQLRCLDWGFRLGDVRGHVIMRHSKHDPSVPFVTAEMTAKRLPDCRMIEEENDVHFSFETLDRFVKNAIAPYLTGIAGEP